MEAGTIDFLGAGECTITADQAGDALTWEAAPRATLTFMVAPAVLTVTAPTLTFTYGSAVPATGPAITGFIGSDTVDSLDELPSCGRAWTGARVGHHDTGCAGGSDPRYRFEYVGGTATVTPAAVTVTASSAATGYGLAVPAVTAIITGLVGGDTGLDTAPRCSTTATRGSPVGDYPTVCTGGADPDYTVTSLPGSLEITAATLMITPAPLSVEYGDARPDVLPEYVGLSDGDTAPATPPVCTTAVDADSGVGTYSSACADAADPNYVIGYADGTVQVTPAALVVAATDLTTRYGSDVPELEPSYEGLAGGDSAPATPPTCAVTATASSPMGDYPISCAGAADPNYTIAYRAGALTVAPALLTITASSWTGVIGTAIPAITATYSGLVLGEPAPAVAPECATTATAASPVGRYPATCTGAEDANYAISYVSGKVEISAAKPVPPTSPSPAAPTEPDVPTPGTPVDDGVVAPVVPEATDEPGAASPTPTLTPSPPTEAGTDTPGSPSEAPPAAGPDLTWLLVLGLVLAAMLAVLGGVWLRRR